MNSKLFKNIADVLFSAFSKKLGWIIMNNKEKYLDLFLWIAVGFFLGVLVYYGFFAEAPLIPAQNVSPPTITAPEVKEPPKVNITVIQAPDCEECMSVHYLFSVLEVNLPDFGMQIDETRNLTYDSEEAQQLISDYDVELLPTLFISSNAAENAQFVTAWEQNGLGSVENDGMLVFRGVLPPYYSVADNEVHGLVEGIAITADDCERCEDMSYYLSYFESNWGIVFSEKKVLGHTENESSELIERYNITKVPTFLLNSDVEYYEVAGGLVEAMTKEEDGWYVFREPYPPYIDLEQGVLRGNVTLIKIVDQTCEDCYDVDEFKTLFSESYGMYFGEELEYDINSTEGIELVDTYNITFVPAFLLSEEASVYGDFREVWEFNQNSVEEDGWFVFRNTDQLAELVYVDLLANETNETAG